MLEVVYLCSAPHPLHDHLLAHFFFFVPRTAVPAASTKSPGVKQQQQQRQQPPTSADRGLLLCVFDNYDCLFLSDGGGTDMNGRRGDVSIEFVGRGIERILLVSAATRIRVPEGDVALILATPEEYWRPLPPAVGGGAGAPRSPSPMMQKKIVSGREYDFESIDEMLSVLPSLLALPRPQSSNLLIFLETCEVVSSRNSSDTASVLHWVSRKTHGLLTRSRDNFSVLYCKLSPRGRPLLEASPRTHALVQGVEAAQLKVMYLRALLRRDQARSGRAFAGPPAQTIALLDAGTTAERDDVLVSARQDMLDDLDRTSKGFVTASQQLQVWKCWATLFHLSPLPPTVQLVIDLDQLLPSTRLRLEHFRMCEERRRVITVLDKSAAATLREDLRTSQALVAARRWVGEQVGNAIGTVGNLVGAKMFYEPTWECEAHPRFGKEMRETHFVLSPGVTHINHSDFPLEPTPVRVARQQWRRCAQIDPVLFRFKSQQVRLLQCVVKLSKKLLCSTSDICLVPSYSHALFTILRSLAWAPRDRLVLVNPPENGQLLAQVSLLHTELGVEVVVARIDPFLTHEETIREFIGVLRKHRPILSYFPHVDNCARVLPIAEMVAACHESSSLSFVDGSDAVGNVTTNVNTLGSDVYAARIDNYLMACPGTTVLVVKPTLQSVIDSLTVSYFYGEGFAQEWTYTGLTDISALLSTYQALQYVKYICFGMREYCRNLAAEASAYLCRAWRVLPLNFPDQDVHAVAIVKIPSTEGCSSSDALHVARTLVEWKVNVGIVCVRTQFIGRMEQGREDAAGWGGGGSSQQQQQQEVSFLAARLTCHVYNDMADVKRLAAAILRFNQIKYSK